MKDEEIIWSNRYLASELRLLNRRIDNFVPMIFEDSEESIEADINARGLDHLRVEGLNLHPAALYLSGNIAIAQHASNCSKSKDRERLPPNLRLINRIVDTILLRTSRVTRNQLWI
jgi:hypothetical protein